MFFFMYILTTHHLSILSTLTPHQVMKTSQAVALGTLNHKMLFLQKWWIQKFWGWTSEPLFWGEGDVCHRHWDLQKNVGCFDGVDSTMFFNLRCVLDLNMIHFGGKSPRFNDHWIPGTVFRSIQASLDKSWVKLVVKRQGAWSCYVADTNQWCSGNC